MNIQTNGYFVVTKNSCAKQPYHWVLKASNSETILTSENYSSKQMAENGIRSAMENSDNLANFEIKQAKDGSYYFNLLAKNHQVIGTSEMYVSKQGMQNGIKAVMKYASHATINDIQVDNSTCDTVDVEPIIAPQKPWAL
ncbi:MAG: YegP family protein [Sulfurovaceae bacterium]